MLTIFKRLRTFLKNIEFIESERIPRRDIGMLLRYLIKKRAGSSSIKSIVKFWYVIILLSNILKKTSKIYWTPQSEKLYVWNHKKNQEWKKLKKWKIQKSWAKRRRNQLKNHWLRALLHPNLLNLPVKLRALKNHLNIQIKAKKCEIKEI